MQSRENRRELFRVSFTETVWGKLTLLGQGGVTVRLLDISSQGALVESDLELSTKSRLFLDFKLNSVLFSVPGTVIRKVVHPEFTHYGIQFSENREQFNQLFRELNRYAIRKAKPYLEME